MNIAVIPARGGSKRIPRKNIKPFRGKPMIAWSIEAAVSSNIFDKIIVSTDDEEIAEIAKRLGAEVPFIRPEELSDDFAGTREVISHATKWVQENIGNVGAVCCIYATAPFVRSEDIRLSYEKLTTKNCAYCFTATEYAAPVYRSFLRTERGNVKMLYPEHFSTRSQDLPVAYHDAGQFYWAKSSTWIDNEMIFSETSIPFVIPRWRVQDIDTVDDWVRAESMAASLLDSSTKRE
jgi:N-acylneuraminate cytidylyltransferase